MIHVPVYPVLVCGVLYMCDFAISQGYSCTRNQGPVYLLCAHHSLGTYFSLPAVYHTTL
jgi:hypothetical protein